MSENIHNKIIKTFRAAFAIREDELRELAASGGLEITRSRLRRLIVANDVASASAEEMESIWRGFLLKPAEFVHDNPQFCLHFVPAVRAQAYDKQLQSLSALVCRNLAGDGLEYADAPRFLRRLVDRYRLNNGEASVLVGVPPNTFKGWTSDPSSKLFRTPHDDAIDVLRVAVGELPEEVAQWRMRMRHWRRMRDMRAGLPIKAYGEHLATRGRVLRDANRRFARLVDAYGLALTDVASALGIGLSTVNSWLAERDASHARRADGTLVDLLACALGEASFESCVKANESDYLARLSKAKSQFAELTPREPLELDIDQVLGEYATGIKGVMLKVTRSRNVRRSIPIDVAFVVDTSAGCRSFPTHPGWQLAWERVRSTLPPTIAARHVQPPDIPAVLRDVLQLRVKVDA